MLQHIYFNPSGSGSALVINKSDILPKINDNNDNDNDSIDHSDYDMRCRC